MIKERVTLHWSTRSFIGYHSFPVNLKRENYCMQTAFKNKIYTISEYFRLEEKAKNKHEYFNGNIVKMPGASFVHNQIAVNVMTTLAVALYNKNFIVLNSDMKIHIPQLESVVYPVAVVVFEKPAFYEERTDV